MNILKNLGDPLEEKAFNMQLKFAKKGIAEAQYDIGVRYSQGCGVEQNYQHAFKWISKAALQGYINAQYHMGICFLDGEGTKIDSKKAFRWFKKAAAQGHVEAIKFVKHMKV